MIRMSIDLDSPVPAYQQVVRSIRIEILSGRLKNGDRLPPIRELAKILKLNPNTVAKAYYTLDEEGFIESRQGSGNWVNLRAEGLDSLRRSMLDGEVRSLLDRALSLGATIADVRESIERIASHG
jgi:GntR family transcriptional regulator